MRTSIIAGALAAIASVSAVPQVLPKPSAPLVVGPLSLDIFDTPRKVVPVPLVEAVAKFEAANATGEQGSAPPIDSLIDIKLSLHSRATCGNVRTRVEWDSYPDSSKQAFVDGIKCLMGRAPSGQFRQSKSRYEDLVALHQTLTPNVHGNSKFLLWHRYLLWTFEDILRTECGFNQPIPWFDETRYAGRFSQSSVFSSRWFGGIGLGGNCVTNGQFANLAVNVGPGSGNQLHCLARNGDGAKTAQCNQGYVDQCNAWGNYADMANCSESGPHAWGHNGIGAVMQDVYASPADPVFWLHHGFVDRNFRIWQNRDSARVNSVNGNDIQGRPLTLDTTINVYDFRPTVRIRDILDTTATTLCYKYNY